MKSLEKIYLANSPSNAGAQTEFTVICHLKYTNTCYYKEDSNYQYADRVNPCTYL